MYLKYVNAWHTDEESCQDKKSSKVDSNNSLKKETFKVVGTVNDDKHEEGGDICCHKFINDASLQCNGHADSIFSVT